MLLKTIKEGLYHNITESAGQGKKLLAVLLDPDKIDLGTCKAMIDEITRSPATHIFVGGSEVNKGGTDELVILLKRSLDLPVMLFPGHPSQISIHADGILFLSLISGRNPEYLIGHQVSAAPLLHASRMQVIPTAYMLIDGGNETAVQRISRTTPMPQNNLSDIVNTAIAGEMIGNHLIYLEAGSGAKTHVSEEIVAAVRANVGIPIIVGGGIRSAKTIQQMYSAGADLVVIGNAFEEDIHFFNP